MAVDTQYLKEKTTSPLDMQLLADGDPINLSGVDHVRMDMIDAQGQVYRYASNVPSPCVEIFDAINGKVRFSPPSESIFSYLKSPYRIYWTIFNTTTQHYACPDESWGEIVVQKEF